MDSIDNTQDALVHELAELRQQVADLNRSAARQERVEETLRQRLDDLTILNDLSQAVNHKLAPKQVAKAALENLVQALQPDVALIFARKDSLLQLYDHYAVRPMFADGRAQIDHVGECLCGTAVSTGKPVYSRNIQHDLRCTISECEKAGLVSFAAFPLEFKGQVIGVLGLGSYTDLVFEEQGSLLEALAGHIATALGNAQQFDQTKKRTNYLIALSQATEDEFELNSVLQTIVNNLVENANIVFARIWLVDESGQVLILKSSAGLYARLDGHRSRVRIDADQYKLGEIARSRQPFVTNQVQELEQFDHQWAREQDIIAFAGYPLLKNDRLMGVLAAFSREAFNDDVLDMLADFSNHAAIAVKNAQLYAAEKEQRTLAESLRDNAAALSSTLNLDEVLDRILANLENVSSHGIANIMLVENRVARVVRHRGYAKLGVDANEFEALRFEVPDTPVFRQMSETGQPVYVSDTHQYPGWKDLHGTRGIRSTVGAPIRSQGKTLGFLNLDSGDPDAFSPDLTKYLLMFADQAGMAIQNAHYFRVSWDQATRLAALNAISTAAMSSLELESVLRHILELACRTLNATKGFVLLSQPALAQDTIYSYPTDCIFATPREQLVLGTSIPEWVMKFGQSVQSNEVGQDIRFAGEAVPFQETETEALLCVPLISREKTTGVIEVIKHAGKFSEDDLSWLKFVTTITAMALENIRLYTDMRARADELVMLNQLGLVLSSTLDFSALIEQALYHVSGLVQADVIAIFLVDPESNGLRCIHRQFGSPLVDVLVPCQPGDDVIGRVIKQGSSELIEDVTVDSRWDPRLDKCLGIQTRAITAVSLETSEHIIGALGAFSDKPALYTSQDQRRLQIVASTLAVTLDKARLHGNLKALLREREQTQAQLIQSAKMSALGRLVASIAHEINNPIQAIQGYLTLAQEEVTDGLRPDKLDRYLGVVASEISRIAIIVERMRDFYRPAHDELRATDVHYLLTDVLALTHKQLQRSQVTVEREWSRQVPVIRANPDHLKQVFLNLVINAADAMPDGGTLRIRTTVDFFQRYDPPLRHTGPLQPAVRIEFNNGGDIIPPEILPHLFEPFFTTKEQGSGLGLYISYGIIEAHHGQISMTSEVDKGTTVTILLPIE